MRFFWPLHSKPSLKKSIIGQGCSMYYNNNVLVYISCVTPEKNVLNLAKFHPIMWYKITFLCRYLRRKWLKSLELSTASYTNYKHARFLQSFVHRLIRRFFKIGNWKFLFSNNFLKKSTREGNGRDLEETDPSLLKFYVTEYYTYHLGRLVLTKPTPLGKRMEPSPKWNWSRPKNR